MVETSDERKQRKITGKIDNREKYKQKKRRIKIGNSWKCG